MSRVSELLEKANSVIAEAETLRAKDIRSVGWLNNQDKSVALSISKRGQNAPIFVRITKAELDDAGGKKGLTANKQKIVDFYNKYGSYER